MVNANWPTMTFEACFNVDPFDPAPPAAVWTNLTSRVVAWQHQTPSGRQYELARTEAAAIGVLLDNQDGALDPSNASSPYWPNVLPYRQWRQRAGWTANNLLVGNSSTFDGGLGTWGPGGGTSTLLQSTAQAHGGPGSMRMTSVGGGTMYALSDGGVPANRFAATPGTSYVSWAWYRANSTGRQVQQAIDWWTVGGAYISTSVGPLSTDRSDGWTLALVSDVAPVGAALADVSVNVLGTSAGEIHFVDDAGFGSGTYYNLAAGYVERWPQRWDQHKAWVDAVVVDTLALLDPKTFRSCYDEEILADSPVGYYPLSEPAGAQSFGSIATTQQPNAPVVNSKYGGGTVTAGEQAIVPTDPAACVSFAGANGGFAKIGSVVQLAAAGHGPYTVNQAGTGWSVELWFQAAAAVTDPGKLWSQVAANVGTGLFGNGAVRLNINGTLVVSPVDSGGTTPTSPRYDDGKPHHVVFGFDTDGKAWKLYVDGALVISGTNAAVFQSNSPGFGWAQVGGLLTSGAQQEFLGTGATVFVSHVAIYVKLLSAAQALAHYTAGATAFSGELSGARFSRLLRYAAYQGPSSVDTGQSQMAPASLDGLGVTAALQDVVVAENGNLLVAGDGTVTFKQRSTRYNTTAVATLGELETPYLGDLAVGFDPTFLYERVEVTRPGGVTVAAFDLAGQKRYGPRTLTETPQILLDLEAQDRANYQLSQYKDPKQRLPQITLDPASNPALWPVVLGTRIGDRLTVKRRPFGAPLITLDVFVEAISHDVDFRVGQAHWRTTYLLSPATTSNFWLAGDATYSIAGVTTVPGY